MWEALGEADDGPDRVAPGGYPALHAHLPVAALTRGAVAAASLAAALLADDSTAAAGTTAVTAAETAAETAAGTTADTAAGTDTGQPLVALDAGRILTAVTSERHFRVDGEAPEIWAELSGFWRCGDGWIRTHTNYPHHRARLLRVLGLPDDADGAAFSDRLAGLDPFEVEGRAATAGAIAAAVRTEEEWARHPQAEAVRRHPLVVREQLGGAPAASRPAAASVRAPLAGIRVLDLTRVIAGPVATRTLALLGADVLRVDTPTLPEMGRQHLDTGIGKRSTLLDLTHSDDARVFDELLATADVVVTGYRPGALARFGLAPADLAARRPGLIVGQVSAWGESGPWAGRRGFDSIVQAVSGIAMLESPDGRRPGVLPAQALDHTAGYLLAAGIMSSLRRQRAEGGSWSVAVALARIAQELLQLPRGEENREAPDSADAGEPTTVTMPTPAGEITCALPALGYAGGPVSWTAPPHPWGSDKPEWVAGGAR